MKICDIYSACAALKKPAFAGIYALTEGFFTARLNGKTGHAPLSCRAVGRSQTRSWGRPQEASLGKR
jgi:hypothetical protein